MKKYLVAVSAALLMVSAVASAWEEGAPAAAPSYSVNVAERIRPGMMDEYVETTKQWLAAIKSAGLDLSVYSFTGESTDIHFSVQISSMAQLDTLAQTWAKAVALMDNTDWGATRKKCIEWRRYVINTRVDKASYRAADPEVPREELQYFKWKDYRVRPGDADEFLAVLGKVKSIYEKHGIRRSYSVYRDVIGSEGPIFTIVTSAKDPGDMHNAETAIRSTLANDLKPHMDALEDLTVEYLDGVSWTRPDLSLLPEM